MLPSPAVATPLNRSTSGVLERNERIEKYLPLVAQVAAKMRRSLPSHIDADDLHSAGVTGLIAAVERFDPAQANTFTGYALMRIRGAMLDELRRFDPTPRRSRKRTKQIQIAVGEIEQELGRAPSDQEVGARLQISVEELERWRGRSAPVQMMSLDSQVEYDSGPGSSLHELLADDHENIRETMEKEELQQLVTDRINALPIQQKRILALYYFEGMNCAEIGEALDLTESRICQIRKQAVTSLGLYVQSLRR